MLIYNSFPEKAETYVTFFTEETLAPWRSLGEIKGNPGKVNLTEEELIQEARDADVLLCGWGQVPFTKTLLDGMPNLKIIVYTGGAAAQLCADGEVFRRGIPVLSGNDLYGRSVAEGCLCYVLSSLREMEKYLNEVRTTGWRRTPLRNRTLFGKKVGLIGFGVIAQEFAKLLHAFGIIPLVFSSHMTERKAEQYGIQLASMEEIFASCDIVSIHMARRSDTVGMVTRELLYSMKDGALLMNTARGDIVDEAALLELVVKKKIFAVLDVYTDELNYEHHAPNPYQRLPNVLPMPHIAGASDFRPVITRALAEDVRRFFAGEPMENVATEDKCRRGTQEILREMG